MLTVRTKVYVASSVGTSEMTLQEMANAIRGGLDLETVELTLDPGEIICLERKRLAIARVNDAFAEHDAGSSGTDSGLAAEPRRSNESSR